MPEIAPFLSLRPRPVPGQRERPAVWVWDAYTMTDRYPDAQPLPDGSRFAGDNYVRNSVKVVIDAYDGTVRFFLADPNEPIIAAYARIFPDLFEPLDAMPSELRAHLRYPEDLFTAQNQTYLLYHLPATDGGATTFYNQDRPLGVPGADVVEATGAADGAVLRDHAASRASSTAEFVLIQPLVAGGPVEHDRLGRGAHGPGRLRRSASRSASRPTPPPWGRRRSRRGSTRTHRAARSSASGSVRLAVIRGNLLVLPIGETGSSTWSRSSCRPTGAPFPEFVRVIMVSQDRVAFAERRGRGPAPDAGQAGPPRSSRRRRRRRGRRASARRPSGRPGVDVAGLVAEAQRLYAEAQAGAGGRRPRHLPGADRRARRRHRPARPSSPAARRCQSPHRPTP